MSIEPAPSPNGIENKQRKIMLLEIENPKSEIAVIVVLTAVTTEVENLFMSFVESKLDIIVPNDIIMVIKLAQETGKDNSCEIPGQAAPKRESGIPKPMNVMYIMISKIVAIL